MSLKAFHIVFIAASILLAFLVGGWGLRQFLAGEGGSGLMLAIVFLVSGCVLVVYGMRFVHKLKELGI